MNDGIFVLIGGVGFFIVTQILKWIFLNDIENKIEETNRLLRQILKIRR